MAQYDSKVARGIEGFCLDCDPLQPMKEVFLDEEALPIDKNAKGAYKFYKCLKCGLMFDPDAFYTLRRISD